MPARSSSARRVLTPADVLLLITLPAPPPRVHDKTVKLEQLELPVLRAMIYETFLLNMCGALVVTLPDILSSGDSGNSVPFSFQIAGPCHSDLDVLSLSSVVASHLTVESPTH